MNKIIIFIVCLGMYITSPSLANADDEPPNNVTIREVMNESTTNRSNAILWGRQSSKYVAVKTSEDKERRFVVLSTNTKTATEGYNIKLYMFDEGHWTNLWTKTEKDAHQTPDLVVDNEGYLHLIYGEYNTGETLHYISKAIVTGASTDAFDFEATKVEVPFWGTDVYYPAIVFDPRTNQITRCGSYRKNVNEFAFRCAGFAAKTGTGHPLKANGKWYYLEDLTSTLNAGFSTDGPDRLENVEFLYPSIIADRYDLLVMGNAFFRDCQVPYVSTNPTTTIQKFIGKCDYNGYRSVELFRVKLYDTNDTQSWTVLDTIKPGFNDRGRNQPNGNDLVKLDDHNYYGIYRRAEDNALVLFKGNLFDGFEDIVEHDVELSDQSFSPVGTPFDYDGDMSGSSVNEYKSYVRTGALGSAYSLYIDETQTGEPVPYIVGAGRILKGDCGGTVWTEEHKPELRSKLDLASGKTEPDSGKIYYRSAYGLKPTSGAYSGGNGNVRFLQEIEYDDVRRVFEVEFTPSDLNDCN